MWGNRTAYDRTCSKCRQRIPEAITMAAVTAPMISVAALAMVPTTAVLPLGAVPIFPRTALLVTVLYLLNGTDARRTQWRGDGCRRNGGC